MKTEPGTHFSFLQDGYTFVVGISNETLMDYMYMSQRIREWECNVRIRLSFEIKITTYCNPSFWSLGYLAIFAEHCLCDEGSSNLGKLNPKQRKSRSLAFRGLRFQGA